MEVILAYGRSGLKVELPESKTTVIKPQFIEGLKDEKAALVEALRSPLSCPSLRESVRSDQRVAISICDVTRPMPSKRVLPVLLAELGHVPAEQIRILVATGTHRATRPDELKAMLGEEILRKYEVINHDSTDGDQLVSLGQTDSGIPILLNRTWVESDFRITTGFVEPHFFAGFSGGPKLVAPGLAGLRTVMDLHSAALIADPDSTWGTTLGNPIHDSIREIAEKTIVHFSLDVTLNSHHEITSVFAGELLSSHRIACEYAKRTAMRPLDHPFDIVITTNSGYPLDLNLYQSVKGMSAAARVVKPGGVIICAAECSDGIPDHGEYGQILSAAANPEEVLTTIHSPGFSTRDQWQAQIQAQVQKKAKVYFKSSFLTPEQVKAAHLEWTDSIEKTVEQELTARGESARICVLPLGPQTIPYLTNEHD